MERKSDDERANDAQVTSLLRDMESDIEGYPESASEIMIETVEELRRMGRLEHAIDLSARIIADFPGNPDAGYAYSSQIEVLFELGRDDEAEAAIAELWERGIEARQVAPLIAGFLEERGDRHGALRWADRGVEDALTPGGGVGEFGTMGDILAAQERVGIRRRLGLAPDDVDRWAEHEDPFRQIRGLVNADDSAQEGLAALGVVEPPPVRDTEPGPVVLSHIVRSDIAAAYAEGLLAGFEGEEEPTLESYFREVELNRRWMRAETAFSKGKDVAISLAEIQEFAKRLGIDVLTPQVRNEAALDKYERGGDFPIWPPERNEPCWCGSGRKYKKCCGRP